MYSREMLVGEWRSRQSYIVTLLHKVTESGSPAALLALSSYRARLHQGIQEKPLLFSWKLGSSISVEMDGAANETLSTHVDEG